MGDSFIWQLPSQHLLCASGQEDPTAALRKHPFLQERLDRSAWIDGGRQNMPRAGLGPSRGRAHIKQNHGLGIPSPGVELPEAESELFRPG